jgi:glycosyltransferase involved in cell wall biosynthesis
MAAGKPIVTTNVGGIPDMVTEGNTALIVESENPGQLSKALNTIINDTLLREKMSSIGPAFVKQRYSDARLISEVRSLYLNLLKVNA